LKYDKYNKGWHYTKPDYFLPSRFVSKDDFLAVLVMGEVISQYEGTPMGKKMNTAFSRVLELFRAEEAEKLKQISSRICFSPLPTTPIDSAIWVSLLKAIQLDQRLHLTYQQGGNGAMSVRDFDLYGMIVRDRDWYLFGYCHLAKENRTFGLPFVRKAVLKNEYFEVPANFSIKQYAKTGFHGMHTNGEAEQTIVLRFHPDLAGRIEARPMTSDQVTKKESGGYLRVSFKVDAMFRVEQEILHFGDRVEVLEPPELRARIQSAAQSIGRLYKK
jgi:predicted DNA-binding transcriptional regulator YafY